MNKKILGLLMALTLLIGVVGCGNTGDGDGTLESATGEDPVVIRLGATPYLHAEVIYSVFAEAYKELGYEVERVEGDVGFMFLGISQDDIDIHVDGWLPVLSKSYVDKYKEDLEIMNPFYENAPVGFAVPTYMEEIHTVQDLIDNAELFDNKVVGIEPGTGTMETAHKALEAYDATGDFEVIESSTPAMLGEVGSKTKAEEPIAFIGWRPHSMFAKYDIKILEDEKGVWNYDSVMPLANKSFKDKAPEAYEFSNNFTISIDDLEAILYEAETTDATVDSATLEWFADNRQALDAILD